MNIFCLSLGPLLCQGSTVLHVELPYMALLNLKLSIFCFSLHTFKVCSMDRGRNLLQTILQWKFQMKILMLKVHVILLKKQLCELSFLHHSLDWILLYWQLLHLQTPTYVTAGVDKTKATLLHHICQLSQIWHKYHHLLHCIIFMGHPFSWIWSIPVP